MVGTRQRIFLFLVAVVIAALVSIATLAGRSGRSCEEWQTAYEEANGGVPAGALQFINQGPMTDLEARRPPGCEVR